MKVALVFPKSTFLIDPMVYPPLGLWYIAAQLEALGIETDFFDLSSSSFPLDNTFDQIWVSATSPQIYEVRTLGETAKRYRTPVVLGGPAPWSRSEEYLHMGYDLVVSGEVDHPNIISLIVDRATTRRKRVHSLFLSTGVQASLDHVLPPVRRWAHRYTAFLEDQGGTQHLTTTMFSSRGCPMGCAFCESGRNGVIWGPRVRFESLEVVEQQLDDIVAGGFTGVMFYDDIFPINKPRTREMMKLLKDRNLVWRCFLRTDVIAKQGGHSYLEEMRDAGLVEVLAGVESADNRIKDNIGKGTTIEQDTDCLLWCKDLGIRFKASLILGLPGETRESMENTRKWVLQYRPDRVDINTLIPFPGTPIMTHPENYDVSWTEKLPETYWYKGPREESQCIVRTSALSPEEIQEFRDNLVAEVNIPY